MSGVGIYILIMLSPGNFSDGTSYPSGWAMDTFATHEACQARAHEVLGKPVPLIEKVWTGHGAGPNVIATYCVQGDVQRNK
jgi:hypothetical protein